MFLKWSNEAVFRFYEKKSSNMPCVVCAEDSKKGLRFEIGPSYVDVQMRSQLVTDKQFSCSRSRILVIPLPRERLPHHRGALHIMTGCGLVMAG